MKKSIISKSTFIIIALIGCIFFAKPFFKIFKNTETIINKIGDTLFEFNNINVTTTNDIDLNDVEIKVGDRTIFHNGRHSKRIVQEYGHLILKIYYQNILVAEVGHFKTNNWYAHDYDIHIEKEKNQILVRYEINGPSAKNDNFQKRYIYEKNDELLKIDYLTESGEIYNTEIIKSSTDLME